MSHIVSLTAENFKRLKAVEITPDGNVVVISGRNAQGKSSVLDAIWAALAGKAGAKNLDRPIRDGETSATVTVELDDLVVTRRWTEKTNTLTVASKDGRKYSKPQQVLDDLIGRLAFDPLEFANMRPADQRAALLQVVDLPFVPEDVENARRRAYDARTEANREARRLKAVLDTLPEVPAGTPDEAPSISDLAAQYNELAGLEATMDRALSERDRINAEIARLQAQLDETLQGGREAAARIAEISGAGGFKTARDASIAVQNAEKVAHLVRVKQDRAKVEADFEAAVGAAQVHADRIADLDRVKAEGLAAAQMPVVGLGFDDEGVTLNGVPFTQASAAERLKVSVAMAMAMNPTVRVICIRDAALLDQDSMAALYRFAAARDFQIWVERVDPQQGVGVIIEDGQVQS